MIESLINIDQQLLLAINGWHAEWADNIMWLISGKLTWIPLYLLLTGLLFWRFGWKKALWMLLAIGVTVGLADYISSGIIKHLVCRPRPTHEPVLEGLVHIVNGYRGGHYGFVSSHAANTMGVALLYCLIWKNESHHVWWLMLWVILNCWSRMYLGVHYPGDIIGGLCVGALIAVAVYIVLQRWVLRDRQPVAVGADPVESASS